MTHHLPGCVVDVADLVGGLAPGVWCDFAGSTHLNPEFRDHICRKPFGYQGKPAISTRKCSH